MSSSAVVSVDLQGKLRKIASGKVRDLFEVDDDTLLFVATDRISAYDVVMENGIPGKGTLLTKLSIYWFDYLQAQIPGLRTHYITSSLPSVLDALAPDSRAAVHSRSMQVRRLEVIPLESIVRGYITGSAWSEYKDSGTVHGIPQPPGLVQGQKLPKPIWTPSTKAAAGEHDENITPEKARQIVGEGHARTIEKLSLELYEAGAKRAEEVGMILADTKFEFGHEGDHVVLIDEVLTPDSSRFWPKETWEQNLGRPQPSFDKQFLRDWLTSQGLKGADGVTIAEDIAERTALKYQEACARLTGDHGGEPT